MTKELSVVEATELVTHALTASGLTTEDAAKTAEHLIDCELRGLAYGGLPRALSVAERLRSSKPSPGWRVERETPIAVTIDGRDTLGYVVAQRATELAIEKATSHGICVAAARDTWLTGMFSWYLEQVTAAGLVGLVAGNGGKTVAPHGSSEALLGTNPIAFGFPSTEDPIIWDSGTSSITYAEVVLAGRLGDELPAGSAYDPAGLPTTTPAEALAGAFTVWGGHRGSGLSLSVHLLGMLTGSPALPRRQEIGDLGFLLVAIDPGLLTDADDYKRRVAEHANRIRASRPVDPGRPVRVPFDRSREVRAESRRRGIVVVEDSVFSALTSIADPTRFNA
ncbi:Ldh family oxidoreductase [Aeromicrobium tamlense]|uniref:LDH2 family malate/lactate/ureidoglycolate dehydrogenase n=1 Tax=Aeromicrobium tamlense TaxID=375541 RepID=A0A8I0KNG5_9ACTN|nr:Ldh family oxidoreductase [Aeromicrobium tamlense]MBD1270744.1 Ldh family oxidoreductase [Aeromicrobium tamlense]MBD1271124.1 Ldh family oxidoreductase [Aeromicrobium tamlense]NYI38136.1 LDH2 family malate/lactate/ureidoglycolate dehydrogenase [Aeromicrobium tamlense]